MQIAAVIVLYFPDSQLLDAILGMVCAQVNQIVLIENTPGVTHRHFSLPVSTKTIYKPLNANLGIARAQNIGVEQALRQGAKYILFLDQDSVPEMGLVNGLLMAENILSEMNENVAAIGPAIKNQENGNTYRARVAKGHIIRDSIVKVNQLISSGSLIRAEVWEKVGNLEADLFIDDVDFEWCWRARKIGLNCFIANNVFLSHRFGQQERKWMGMQIPIPLPARCYYLYRNYLILARRSYVPLYWKVSFLFKFILRFLYYSTSVRPQKAYFRNMIKGIYDGIKVEYGQPAKE